MKKSLLTLTAILLTSIAFTQIKHNKFTTTIEFNKNGTGVDFPRTSVTEIPNNGGYFLSNFYKDFTSDFIPSLTKLDYEGNVVMDTVYNLMTNIGSSQSHMVTSKINTSGNAILYTTSTTQFQTPTASPYLIKTDLSGNILWHYAYSNDTLELEAEQLITTQDGGYLILGKMLDFNAVEPPSGFAIKIDVNGGVQWDKLYANKDTMAIAFNDGMQLSNGDFFYVGSNPNSQASKQLDLADVLLCMIRTDNVGNTIWNKSILFNTATIATDWSLNHVSCGMLNDTNAFISFPVRDSFANLNQFGIKSVNVDNGNTNWTKYYSMPAPQEFDLRTAIADGKGNIIITGQDINTGALFMIDGQGNVIESRKFSFNAAHSNFPLQTINTADGGFVHLNEISQTEVLMVKTEANLDPVCADVDNAYFTLTPAVLNDTAYINLIDSTFSLNGLMATQLGFDTPITIENDDSLICACSNTIQGFIDVGGLGLPAENATIILFKKGMIPDPWTGYDTTQTDIFGNYQFIDVPSDSFIIKVMPDPILQPNSVSSYFKQLGDCYKWDSAGVFHISCDSGVVTNNISLIVPPTLTGGSTLNGYVWENTGGFSKQIPGDPIPGIDITVEQSPGGVLGTSSTNGSGFYNLAGLNANATLIISVDYPGMPNDSVYTMIINATDTIFDSLNFYMDTTGIYIINAGTGVGVNSFNADELKVDLYPNPSSDNFYLNLTATKTEEVYYELTNELGQTIFNNSKNLVKGKNKISLNTKDIPSGIYFLKIKQEKHIYFKKLIKL